MNEMNRRRFTAAVTAAIALGSTSSNAADFPSRPIKIIVPWPAGGGGDVVVRVLAPAVSERLNTPVVVDNRPGATGTIGSGLAATSPADGYTLVYGSADSNSIMPNLMKSLSYDGRKAFTAIAPIGFFPFVLAVHPSVPATNVKELVQISKTSGGPMPFGSWGVGSSGQVFIESIKAAADVNLLHVPYQGTGPLLTALLADQVKGAMLPMQLAEQHAKSGAIRLLGVATPERMVTYPSLPTLREQGVRVDLTAWVGFLAPANVPTDIVARLHQAIQAASASPAIAEKLRQLHVIPQPISQRDYQAFVDAEYDRWGKVIQQARITLE